MGKRLQTSPRQRQRAKMKPLRVALAVTTITGILVTVLIIIFNVGTPQQSNAAGTCSSCDYIISGNFTGKYEVASNERLCITPTGNFTGELKLKRDAEVCNSGILNPSKLDEDNHGAYIVNHNIAIFSFTKFEGSITNSGTMTFTDKLDTKTFINTGDVEIQGEYKNKTNSGGLANSGNFVVIGKFTNEGILDNNGFISVDGDFKNDKKNGASFTNNDSLYVTGNFENKNDLTNNGGINILGDFDNSKENNTSLTNNGNFYLGGDMSSEEDIQNTGMFTVNGNMTLKDVNGATLANDSIIVVNGNFTNENIFTNNSYVQVNGTYTNTEDGTIEIGPGSLMEIDSLINQGSIENNNTPYGQVKIQSYLDNSGTIATYVDICKSGSGPTFDSNTGVVHGSVTQCTNNSPLPVELISFTARKSEGAVLLEWATASEVNNRLFEVQRMVEGESFQVITEITGTGNSKTIQRYRYTDATALANKNIYYRLRQVDFDGRYAYSGIVIIRADNKTVTATDVTIYPNPVSRQEPLRVVLHGDWQEANYQVQNMSGNITVQGKITSGGQIMTNNLNPGIYLVKVFNGDNTRTTKVIVR